MGKRCRATACLYRGETGASGTARQGARLRAGHVAYCGGPKSSVVTCINAGDVLLGRVTDYPRQRHLFLLRDLFESFVKIGRKCNRCPDCRFPLSLWAPSLRPFFFHWAVPSAVTTLHHIGDSPGPSLNCGQFFSTSPSLVR